jgi:hypothetical protein
VGCGADQGPGVSWKERKVAPQLLGNKKPAFSAGFLGIHGI